MRLTAGRAKHDPEKAVIPAIIYSSKSGGGITAHAVSVGWWDWHVTLLWSTR